MYKKSQHVHNGILIAGDALFILLAFTFSYWIRSESFRFILPVFPVQTMILLGSFLLSFFIFGLYDRGWFFENTRFLSHLLVAVIFATVFNILVYYFFPFWKIGRDIATMNAELIFLLMFLWRVLVKTFYLSHARRKNVLILGAGSAGLHVCDVVKAEPSLSLLGFIDDDPKKCGMEIKGIRVLGNSSLICEMIDRRDVDVLVVAITRDKSAELLKKLLYVKMTKVEIYDVSTIYEDLTGKLLVLYQREDWVVFASFRAMDSGIYVDIKRAGDAVLSLIGLLLAFPVIVLVAIAVKLDSPGPVFYRQERTGERGRKFWMYKFRSMLVGSEQRDGGLYTRMCDARVTCVGKVIRKIRFDELPQLWNILIGDMSLVGPRPEAVELARKYAMSVPHYELRHTVKPGLTGWAQVHFPYGVSSEDALEKFKYDMYYLKNMSFLLDVQIVLKTISVIIFREFSR